MPPRNTDTRSDASAPLSKVHFLKWVEKGLKIDLSTDVTVEDTAKALGVWVEDQPGLDPAGEGEGGQGSEEESTGNEDNAGQAVEKEDGKEEAGERGTPGGGGV